MTFYNIVLILYHLIYIHKYYNYVYSQSDSASHGSRSVLAWHVTELQSIASGSAGKSSESWVLKCLEDHRQIMGKNPSVSFKFWHFTSYQVLSYGKCSTTGSFNGNIKYIYIYVYIYIDG